MDHNYDAEEMLLHIPPYTFCVELPVALSCFGFSSDLAVTSKNFSMLASPR